MKHASLLMLMLLFTVPPAVRAEVFVERESRRAVLERVLVLVNEARSQARRCGRQRYAPAAPLAMHHALDRAAQQHASAMARDRFFDHRAPDGSAPKDRVRDAGYRPRLTGENIAFAPESAEEVVRGWLASPGHCANIMDARFSQTGLGLAEGAQRGHIYWVQTFGAPLSAPEPAR